MYLLLSPKCNQTFNSCSMNQNSIFLNLCSPQLLLFRFGANGLEDFIKILIFMLKCLHSMFDVYVTHYSQQCVVHTSSLAI